MPYEIELTPAAVRDLKKMPAHYQRRVRDAIDNLGHDPRPEGVKKLSGEENLWRIRVGEYRVVYGIEDKRLVVLVIRIGHRKDIYRKKGRS